MALPVRPKKSLGQHFLRDENIARKIVGSINPEIPLILEVGPGMGVLTKYLLENPALDPWFLEIDRESAAFLERNYPEIGDRLIVADFMKFDFTGFPPAEPNSKRPFTIIGNFPYNISSQILFRVLEIRHRVKEVVGMFQKEVAMRIAAPPGSKTYGILSVLLQAHYDIEYLFTVDEHVFQPRPKVKSAVIRLRRNPDKAPACDERLFTSVVKTAFNQRRKTLRNSLRGMIPESALPELAPFLSERPEQLGLEEFGMLTGILERHIT